MKSIETIRMLTCDVMNTTPAEVEGIGRPTHVVMARNIISSLSRKEGYSFSVVQKYVGAKDHSGICYQVQSAKNLRDTDRKFKESYDRVEKLLRSDDVETKIQAIDKSIESAKAHLADLMKLREMITS